MCWTLLHLGKTLPTVGWFLFLFCHPKITSLLMISSAESGGHDLYISPNLPQLLHHGSTTTRSHISSQPLPPMYLESLSPPCLHPRVDQTLHHVFANHHCGYSTCPALPTIDVSFGEYPYFFSLFLFWFLIKYFFSKTIILCH